MQIQNDKIVTRSGECPVAGATLTIHDTTTTRTKTSTTGIWLAVLSVVLLGWLGGLGLLGLFFLLMKDTVVSGMITATVTNGSFVNSDYIQMCDQPVAYHDEVIAYLVSLQTTINMRQR